MTTDRLCCMSQYSCIGNKATDRNRIVCVLCTQQPHHPYTLVKQLVQTHLLMYCTCVHRQMLQWNPSIGDTMGPPLCVRIIEASVFRRLPVCEFLSDAPFFGPFFGLSLWAEFKLTNCACVSGWSCLMNLHLPS